MLSLNIPGQTSIRNLPDFDVAILRGRSNDIVVMRTPSNVQYGALVASNEGGIGVNPTRFRLWQDEESASSSGLDYDGDEFWIDGAEGRVPGGF